MIIHNDYDVLVIGSGAAGYNSACRIKEEGKKKVAIITEGINVGTSRNTGSDKQTYYKLGLGGDKSDSVRLMAENLFSGGCMDGDNALCEAALSSRSFFNLCEAGVQFPSNRYGEYIGYKTDHDPYARATSAGPLTSKFMTEALEKKAITYGIKVFDKLLAIEILKYEDSVVGLLCLDIRTGDFISFSCTNIILATGGPAGIYADSAYPACHTGSSSLAIKAGASMQNLTEWQYGLASVNPRWNVSGTYMQVLPRFVSVDDKGIEYEFLNDYFDDIYTALSMVFLKGYQWPFDSKKVLDGSSVIDLLVYNECVLKKRKVYLDFTKNPFDLIDINFSLLSNEAFDYLNKADCTFGKPIDRLEKMNMPAIEHYREKGIDISKEKLEIALCAQHNNGGIAVDMWWQTSVNGLFAVGECAGTHGVSRPGGSALNSGQVGSLRAATYISAQIKDKISQEIFEKIVLNKFNEHILIKESVLCNSNTIPFLIEKAQRRMSDNAAAIRNKDTLINTLKCVSRDIEDLTTIAKTYSSSDLYLFYKLEDILLVQKAVIMSMINYIEVIGKTRGSSLYTDSQGEKCQKIDEIFRFTLDDDNSKKVIQEIRFNEKNSNIIWRNVRPIPENDDFFENVWRVYRKNKNIF